MKSQTLEEYQAVRDAVGFLDLSDRGKIEVTGPDRITFLHSMISNDVKELPEWSGRYGTFLTARGRIVSDFFYYKFPEQIILDITTDLLAKTVQTLEKYIVMDEVELKDVSSDSSHFSLQGPGASNLVQELLGNSGPEEQYAVQEVKWQETTLWLIRKNELAESGFEMIVPRKIAPSLRAALEEKGSGSGLREIGEEARNILRLEAAIPWYGVDMDENRYPVEARLDQAISYTKGCYLGQETVARIDALGRVNRLLRGIRINSNEIPPPGGEFVRDGKVVARITSSCWSYKLQAPLALAYVRRAFTSPASPLHSPDGDGEIVALPLI
ncbi:MAG: aminomethyl transferase family protein [Acidobacteria bacterium]|nr:aminomethyl transferase family protein [Acidobacteriota bacterium]